MRIIVLLMLLCQLTCAQKIPLMSLKVKEDTLACSKSCDKAIASLIFTNDSDSDILIYGLKHNGKDRLSPAFNGLSGLCDVTRTGTGAQFALYHPDGTQQLAEFEIVDHDIRKNRVTKKMMDSVFRVANKGFLESARILKAHEEITFETEVPLEQFNLQKGLYYFQVVYYCGNKSAEVLDSHEVKRPAPLFQGCATSAKIPFIVSHVRKSK
ncbi:MAG: hypothetical protein JST69_09910 [Bacteroidetes bacterium]|nr:hypothetical protein [Bacteroidota bacterium]